MEALVPLTLAHLPSEFAVSVKVENGTLECVLDQLPLDRQQGFRGCGNTPYFPIAIDPEIALLRILGKKLQRRRITSNHGRLELLDPIQVVPNLVASHFKA